jgi:PAS domain S-box-containing protein
LNAAIQVVVPILAAGVTGWCAAYVARHQQSAPGARAYALVLLSQTSWSLCYVAELLAKSVSAKVFWDDLQLPPPYLMAFGMLFFALEYSGRSTRALERWLWLLLALPIASCLWVFTDPLHSLARASARIEADPPFGALIYEFSTVELLSFFEVYVVGAYAAHIILKRTDRQNEVHRRQALLVGGGIVLNLLAGVPALLSYRWLGQRDSSPFCFAISGLCVSWALTRYRLFDLLPIARDAVIEQLPDPVLVLDAKNRLIDANPAARKLFSDGGPVLGTDSTQALPSWLDPGAAQLGSPPRPRELSRPDPQASYELNEASILGERGELRGRALVLRDISERRRAQESLEQARAALEQRVAERTLELETANASLRRQIEETLAARGAAQASEAQFRAIFDGAYELIGMISPEGRLLEANRAALLFAGVTSEEVRGLPFWETPWWTHSPELQGRLQSAIARAAGGEFVRVEVTHRSANGELRVLDFSLTPVFADDGSVASLVAEGRDISERKRTEHEKAQLQAQLYQAQKLDSLGRLAGGVAHDFNNLLTAIIGNVDLARTESIPPGVAEYLHDIEQASFSAAALTRQLLAFARRQIVEPRVLDLNRSMSNVQKLLARLLGENIELRFELEPKLWQVRVDPSHAEQMLVNLAVNARDAMPQGGRLVMRTENQYLDRHDDLGRMPRGEYVVVSITDQGVGMDADTLARIFEPFFTTKPQGLGTGLGLAMVYGAMQQAFGTVEVTSKVGRGTTFRLYFPRCSEATGEGLAHSVQAHPATGSEFIALVEDQALVRATTQRQLESLGYRVIAFEGAERALPNLLRERELSLLITDVVLAGSSGRELAQRIWQARPNLAVLFISGYTEDVVLRQGVALGEVNFLFKPFNVHELAFAVRRAIDLQAARSVRPIDLEAAAQPLTTK